MSALTDGPESHRTRNVVLLLTTVATAIVLALVITYVVTRHRSSATDATTYSTPAKGMCSRVVPSASLAAPAEEHRSVSDDADPQPDVITDCVLRLTNGQSVNLHVRVTSIDLIRESYNLDLRDARNTGLVGASPTRTSLPHGHGVRLTGSTPTTGNVTVEYTVWVDQNAYLRLVVTGSKRTGSAAVTQTSDHVVSAVEKQLTSTPPG